MTDNIKQVQEEREITWMTTDMADKPYHFVKPPKPPLPTGESCMLIDASFKDRHLNRIPLSDSHKKDQLQKIRVYKDKQHEKQEKQMAGEGRSEDDVMHAQEGLLWDYLEKPAQALAKAQQRKWKRKEQACNARGVFSPFINQLRSQGMTRVELSRRLRLLLFESKGDRVSRLFRRLASLLLEHGQSASPVRQESAGGGDKMARSLAHVWGYKPQMQVIEHTSNGQRASAECKQQDSPFGIAEQTIEYRMFAAVIEHMCNISDAADSAEQDSWAVSSAGPSLHDFWMQFPCKRYGLILGLVRA